MKAWFDNVVLPHNSPNKLRHGHIQYGVDRVKDIADFKAFNQNVMHSSVKITDEIYSNLNSDEVQKRIIAMGKTTKSSNQDDYELFQKFLEWKRNNDF